MLPGTRVLFPPPPLKATCDSSQVAILLVLRRLLVARDAGSNPSLSIMMLHLPYREISVQPLRSRTRTAIASLGGIHGAVA
jgi:hypothetical protein